MKGKITKTEAQWLAILSAEQYKVCRQQATERPFSGHYLECKQAGLYLCVCCGHPLFDSNTKFNSGSGWPSFFQTYSSESVSEHQDRQHCMQRIEVRCNRCDAHLGHVFEDGPEPSGVRYCVNSLSLKLAIDEQGKN